jgi:hypothetical protein
VQYADETVVVMNRVPVKPRNGVEEKTQGTPHQIVVTVAVQKTEADVKGGRNLKVCLETGKLELKVLKEHWKMGRSGRMA